jgi:cytochrome c oxidase assembly factor CtaG
MPIYLYGTDEQKQEWVPQLASGAKLAAFGLTEASAGSDAGATRTRAELGNGQWIVNGSKMFITNAGTDITACVTITALTGEDEISNIIVPNGTPGYEISAPMKKLGWHASDTRELSFKDCAVPEGNLLGPRGKGFQQFMEILDGGRISVAAMGVGLAQGAYDLAFSYAKERQQFGRPIAKFQAVQFALADMATEIEAGRQLVYRAGWLKDQGKDFGERRLADPRRLWLHGGVRDLAALPRPEDPGDRRRHERGATHGDRQATRGLGTVLVAHAAWSAPPSVLVPAIIALLLFAQGWRRLRRRGRSDLADWKRAALFAAGLLVVLAGLVSPIHTLGENHLLWVHMLQHVLIGDLGIALIVVAVRGPLLVFMLPPRVLGPIARDRDVRAILSFLLRPKVAFVLWAANLAVWHIPSLYDHAVLHLWLHDLEHACWMLAGLLVWTLLIDPGSHRRLTTAGRIALGAAMFGAGQVLTSVLVFAFHTLYPIYRGSYGVSALTDQKLAGIVMMVEQLLVLGTFAYLLLRPRVRRASLAHA